MKRTIWVFSLTMLLFSTFSPSFTYANEETENEAKEILSNTLEDTMNWIRNQNLTTELKQWKDNYLTLWSNGNKVIFNPNSK